MKERPILFSAPMVRAILAGAKTQTRRVMRIQPEMVSNHRTQSWQGDPAALMELLKQAGRACPYGQPGDRLWVRETFAQGFTTDELTGEPLQFDAEGNQLPMTTWYRATDTISWSDDDGWETNVPWKPSIHMPRTASRITLEVVSVRVERLQDISKEDAIAEGIERGAGFPGWYRGPLPGDSAGLQQAGRDFKIPTAFPHLAYRALWESINGPESWEANPWVWVVEFKRVEGSAA